MAGTIAVSAFAAIPGPAVATLPAASAAAVAAPASATAPTRPNFVIVLTDDQRWDTIGRCEGGFDGYDLTAGAASCMPFVQQHLVAAGTTFQRGYVTTSLCCPARASLLTGRYARHTRVLDNAGWRTLDDRETIATWLDAAGYRTALIGKYLNGYGDASTPPNYIPPGWDSWHALWNADSTTAYQQYNLIERDLGDQPVIRAFDSRNSTSQLACAEGNQYATDLLCRRSLQFLAEDPTDPFFLLLSTTAPHLPARPPSRWTNRYGSLVPPSYPNFNRVPSPRPPRWLPTAPLASSTLTRYGNEFRSILATNRAVDDAVDALVTQLRSDGRLDDTVFFFVSDNGFARGEHRYGDKGCEYEICHRVPFVVVCPEAICPGATPGSVDPNHLVLNIDIAPTVADLSDVYSVDQGRRAEPGAGAHRGRPHVADVVPVGRPWRGPAPSSPGDHRLWGGRTPVQIRDVPPESRPRAL